MYKKTSHKIPGAPGVQLGLIITPFLDMSFQLLAFFIMTYHPSALEAHIPGNLTPPEDFAKKNPKDKKDVTPVDPLPSLEETELNPELDAAITVKIRSVVADRASGKRQPEGGPAQIFVRSSLDTDFQLIADDIIILDEKDKEVIPDEASVWDKIPKQHAGVPPERQVQKILERELKQMGGKSKTNIKLAPDGDLKQEYVMKIFDTCKRAGFTNVHFVPPPVLNTKIKK
jgi:biopolymer transport protein ExbD